MLLTLGKHLIELTEVVCSIFYLLMEHGYTCAKIITHDSETKEFQISKGLLQGDTLAPFLFVIVLDYVMRMALKDNEVELGFQLIRSHETCSISN